MKAVKRSLAGSPISSIWPNQLPQAITKEKGCTGLGLGLGHGLGLGLGLGLGPIWSSLFSGIITWWRV